MIEKICPLMTAGALASDPKSNTHDAKCICQTWNCAWYDEREQQCGILSAHVHITPVNIKEG